MRAKTGSLFKADKTIRKSESRKLNLERESGASMGISVRDKRVSSLQFLREDGFRLELSSAPVLLSGLVTTFL